MASKGEVAVFTDTNMGTRIAISVPPDITAADFKRELERTHFSCFPELGEIQVDGLKVKRKSYFYHLPESIPIKHAFQGLKGTWFLRIEARPLDGLSLSELVSPKVRDCINCINTGESLVGNTEKDMPSFGKERRKEFHSLKNLAEELGQTFPVLNKMKKRKRANGLYEYRADETKNGCRPNRTEKSPEVAAKESFGVVPPQFEVETAIECNASLVLENFNNASPGLVSVTDIVKWPSLNSKVVSRRCSPSSPKVISIGERLKFERNGNSLNMKDDALPQFMVRTPQRTLRSCSTSAPSPQTSRSKLPETDVGKRLFMAAKKLRISASKQRPAISSRVFRHGKLSSCDAPSVTRHLVFEISDSDD